MAYFLAVANRKGGVGKSTIAVMLAHAAAVIDGKRVLILDLDSQCNASLILLGGQGWSEARRAGKTIADYLFDMFDGSNPHPRTLATHVPVRSDPPKPRRAARHARYSARLGRCFDGRYGGACHRPVRRR